MNNPTTIPLWTVYGLIDRKVLVENIEPPEASEKLNVPSAHHLNTLLAKYQAVEALRAIANLPERYLVYLKILPDYDSNLHPSGVYCYEVGHLEEWKLQLLLIAQSEEYREQISKSPSAILNVGKVIQDTEAVVLDEKKLLHPIEESKVQFDAALVALAYQFDAYGIAFILNPLTSNEVTFEAKGFDSVAISALEQHNNLWWYIAQRRALDLHFDQEVCSINVDIRNYEPIFQQITDDVHIKYPATTLSDSADGSFVRSLEKKLCATCKLYHAEVANGIAINDVYTYKLDDMDRKIKKMKVQLQNARQGGPESLQFRARQLFKKMYR